MRASLRSTCPLVDLTDGCRLWGCAGAIIECELNARGANRHSEERGHCAARPTAICEAGHEARCPPDLHRHTGVVPGQSFPNRPERHVHRHRGRFRGGYRAGPVGNHALHAGAWHHRPCRHVPHAAVSPEKLGSWRLGLAFPRSCGRLACDKLPPAYSRARASSCFRGHYHAHDDQRDHDLVSSR